MGTLHSADPGVPGPGHPSGTRRWLFGTLLGASLLVAVHVYVLRAGTGVAGPLLVGDHLFTIALACGLLLLCAALGGSLLRLLRIEHDSAVETLAFSLAAGCGLLGTAILLAGALGGFRPPLLGLLIVAAAAVSRGEIVRLSHRIGTAATELRAKAGRPALIVLGVIGYAMTMQALAPPSDWDTLMYHLRVPAQFLERGAIFVPEDNLHVAQTGLLHMLYVPLLAAGSPAACAVVNVIFALALATMLLTVGHRLFNPLTGRLAAVLLWASPVVILVAVTPRTDVALTFFLFAGHWALLCTFWNTTHAARWLLLAGALLGFAGAMKYQGLAYLPAVAPVVLMASLASASQPRRRAWLLALCAAGCAAAVIPWLVKNWVLLGAPFYPFFADRMLPPWLATLHGSASFPDGIDAERLRPMSAIRAPFDLMSWFTAPESLVPEQEGVWYRANLLFVLIPLAAPLLRNRIFAMLVLPALLYLVIVVAVQSHTNVRYLTPAIPGLTLAAAAVAAAGLARVRNAGARTAIAALVVVVALCAPAAALAQKLARTRAANHAFGLTSADDYWRNSLDADVRLYGLRTARVEGLLSSPEARVLLLFDARGFGYRTAVIQDNVFTNWALLAPLVRSGGCLDSPPFTHVLVGSGALGYLTRRGLDPGLVDWDQFEEFAARCLLRVDQWPGTELYAVVRAARSDNHANRANRP